MKVFFKFLIFIVLTFLYTNSNSEEFTGQIKGRVVDASSGSPLAGANIVVLNTKTGAATDLDGNFEILSLPVGVYAVQASVIGYQAEVKSNIVVNNRKPASLEFALVQTELSLNEVTFKAGYFNQSPDKPVSTSVQSNEEIRRLPGGFEDVVRAISILPGVAQASPGRNDLVVRGGAPSENLFIVDNIEIPNINHFGTQGSSGGPQSYLNLDFVDKVQFSTGGFGAKFGDRLSSITDISLRSGRNDRIGGMFNLASSQFGFDLEGPYSPKGTFLFSARRSYLDFIFDAAGFSFIPEYYDFTAKADYKYDNGDRLSAFGVVALDKVKLNNDNADNRYDNSRILAPSMNQGAGGVSWKHLINRGYISLSLGQNYLEYESMQSDSLLNPIFKNISLEHESSVRADAVIKLTDRTDFSFGTQLKTIDFKADLTLDSLVSPYGDTLYTDKWYNTDVYKSAAYFQILHKFAYLRWSFGGRLDYFNAIDNAIVFSPRSSFSLPLKNNFNINASFGIYRQSPSLVWLVSDERNKKLEYLGVYQYILGIEHLPKDDTRLNLEFYYKDYFNYPVSVDRTYLTMVNTGAGYGGTDDSFAAYGLDYLVSEGVGWSYGAEFTYQKRYSESPFYSLITLTYSKSGFKALNGDENPGTFDQRYILNFGGGYVFNEKWDIAAKFRFASGRPYTPYETDGSKQVSRYNSKRLDANHSLDIRVDRRWYFNNLMLMTYIDIQNIYDSQYNDEPRWDAREQKVVVDESIGILPSIGISVEF